MICKDVTRPRTSQGYNLGGLNEKYEKLILIRSSQLEFAESTVQLEAPELLCDLEDSQSSHNNHNVRPNLSPYIKLNLHTRSQLSSNISQILSLSNTEVRSLQDYKLELSS